MSFKGVPARPYISGGQGYKESPSRVQLESFYNTIGKFPCTVASSTPIRLVTKEVRYIHELSLTLEHSMSISSPTVPGLTSPRALRSRVLQASSTWLPSSSTSSSQNVLLVASGPSFRYVE